MNKTFKQTVAVALTVGSFAAFGPTEGFGIITPASARTTVLSSEELQSLNIKASNGDNIKICDEYNGKEIDFSDLDPESDREFYAIMPAGTNKINVTADVKGKHYTVRIFTSKNEDAKAYDTNDDIYLEDDFTNLYVRTYRSKEDFEDTKDTDVTDCEATYLIHIKKEEAFSKDGVTNSDINSDDSSSNGSNDNSNSGYAQSKDAYKNNNSDLAKVNADDVDDSKKETKTNQWAKDGINWQYYGSDGTPMRSSWVQDTNAGKWYYLQTMGYMTTGWRFIDSDWYYFDNNGVMQTGWVKSSGGDWYYLDSNGKMAKNTSVDGYTLDYKGKMA